MIKNVLITGLPRSGKTTILEEVIAEYKDRVGFITKEVRKDGKRTGFEIETHVGKKIMLADVNFKTGYKVSKYFIDIKNLESIIPEI
jgi:nucleoside-triphosphatase